MRRDALRLKLLIIKMTKTIKELNTHFYGSIIVLAVLFLLVVFKLLGFKTVIPVTTTAEMYAIVITLVAIPLALRMFADKVKRTAKETDKSKAVQSYKNAYFLRLYMVNIVTLGNIVLYALSRSQNFVWLTVVLFVVFAFCKASQSELESVTRDDNVVSEDSTSD